MTRTSIGSAVSVSLPAHLCLFLLAIGLPERGSASEVPPPPDSKVRDTYSGKVVTDWDMAFQMIESRQSNGPRVGEIAPPFALEVLGDRNRKQSLRELHQRKPVVLIFSSWGCDIFRESLGGLQALYSEYHDRAEFAMVYIREAHPSNGFGSTLGRVRDKNTIQDRRATAEQCRRQLRLPFPILIDPIDDPVATRWAAFPIRVFVIDTNGLVIFAGPQGPWGYRPYRGYQHGDGRLAGWDLQFSSETLEEFLETHFDTPRAAPREPQPE